MNRLWKSDRSRSFTNSFGFLSSVPRAWFLKTTSSSHLSKRLATPLLVQNWSVILPALHVVLFGIQKWVASRNVKFALLFFLRSLLCFLRRMLTATTFVSTSRACLTSLARCSARSFLIFSSSLMSSAVSSSSSSSLCKRQLSVPYCAAGVPHTLHRYCR